LAGIEVEFLEGMKLTAVDSDMKGVGVVEGRKAGAAAGGAAVAVVGEVAVAVVEGI
jgi:hypothetical protein